MTPEDHPHAIHALQNAISEIKAILNNGIRTMVNDQKTELATVKDDIQSIRDALTSHVAKKDVVYEIFKRVMNPGVSHHRRDDRAAARDHRLPAGQSGRVASSRATRAQCGCTRGCMQFPSWPDLIR